MAEAAEKDRYAQCLEEEVSKLQACQKEKGLESCSVCSEVMECTIRKTYIQAVYQSMNKGQGGGFDFQ